MLRKPLFWIAFTLFAAGSVWFGVRYFPHAFPIVSLDLRMDRVAALAHARQLQEKYRFGPGGYTEATSFQREQEVQNFVELEGGGTSALREMFTSGMYHPFKWFVRHFKEGEAREAQFWFTPRGDPCGYFVKLPEKEVGAALEPAAAQTIAEQGARDWGVNLTLYRLVEKSREVRPGGRIDHTFVYERPDMHIGAGRYRLRLVVGGNSLTGLQPFVKVPEAFSRRYEEMRSANNFIGGASGVATVVLYLVGGCGAGLFFLLRQRWILWRAPLAWGLFIAFLQLLAGLNSWPLLWLNYDTAVSAAGFRAQQIGLLLLNFLVLAVVFTLSFMAAESLSRRAFPHHLQQWKLWVLRVAASKTMLGRTAAAYLLVPVFFAYEVLLYFATTRWLGWWTPSDTLVDPDVLAAYFPWFSSIAISAQAGFWEESLFRAVPLAGAALLGSRFGKRNWWIAGAMILQAVIFGAGHASYATQPSYARLVELIIPSFMFGALYLVFGLWAAVVLHFAFDVVWFALPIFVSTAPGIWLDRVMVILLVLIPLWVVVAARIRAKGWTEIDTAERNREWEPAPAAGPEVIHERPEAAPVAVHPAVLRYLPVAGLAGLVLWAAFTSFRPDSTPLDVSRSRAAAIANEALQRRGIQLGPEWKALTTIEASPEEPHRFVWRTAGIEKYRELLGEYLPAPRWSVRFARFQGDVAERAEEYVVEISGSGRVTRFRHALPEDKPGASLAGDEARSLAHSALANLFQLDAAALKEVSAVPAKQKNRGDWRFTFSDTTRHRLAEGETRVSIHIAGGSVVDGYKFVHVPEDWSRKERDRQVVPGILRIVSNVMIGIGVLAAIIVAIVSWSRKKFVLAAFLAVLAVGLVAGVANLLNGFPALEARFSTAQPYNLQAAMFLGAGAVVVVLMAVGIGLLSGFGSALLPTRRALPAAFILLTALSLAGVAAGIGAGLSRLGPRLSPSWANLVGLESRSLWIDSLSDPIVTFFGHAILFLLLAVTVDRITSGWTRRKAPGVLLLVLAGFAMTGNVETAPFWLVKGAVTALILLGAWVLVLRHAPELAIIATGVLQVLGLVKEAVSGAYPQVPLTAGVRALVTCMAIWFLYGFVVQIRKPAMESESYENVKTSP